MKYAGCSESPLSSLRYFSICRVPMVPRIATLVAAATATAFLCAPCVIHASPNTLPASSASVEDASVWAARAAEAAAAFHTAFVFPGGRDVLAATANSSTQAQYWNAALVLYVLVDSGAYPGDIGRFYDL